MPRLIQHQPVHDDIARLAYHLWEERGKPDGKDQDFWLEAERVLLPASLPAQPCRTTAAANVRSSKVFYTRNRIAKTGGAGRTDLLASQPKSLTHD